MSNTRAQNFEQLTSHGEEMVELAIVHNDHGDVNGIDRTCAIVHAAAPSVRSEAETIFSPYAERRRIHPGL
jgi:hypothetical protein